MRRIFFILMGNLLLIPFLALGAGELIVNEIAWMGSKTSANDEWIELYNPTASEIDLTGWTLRAQDGTPQILLSGTIPGGGFFLLERTDDTSVPGIQADQIYTGALSNSGEVLLLKDANEGEVDKVDASGGWQEGDNATKETMQRVASGWITATPTPRAANSEEKSTNQNQEEIAQNISPVPEDSPPVNSDANSDVRRPNTPTIQEVSVKPEPTRTVSVKYPTSVYISEFFPDPEGSDSEGEWIELYNDAQIEVVIGGFFLDDQEGGSRPYQILDGTIIPAKGFLLFPRTDTKIALNNKGDEVRLLYPDGSIAAMVTYGEAQEGYAAAYEQTNGSIVWTSTLTPGKPNEMSAKTEYVRDGGEGAPYQSESVKSVEELPGLDLQEVGVKDNLLAAAAKPDTKGTLGDFWTLLLAIIIGAGAMFGYVRWVKKISVFLLISFSLFAIPLFVLAETFFVAPEFDSDGRAQIEATLTWEGAHGLIYVDDKAIVPSANLTDLGSEFDKVIYPRLTELFGPPWTPGIDGDSRVIILLTRMISGIGGYFNADDEVPLSVKPRSNEREMLYLNANTATMPRIRAFLAHEFQHLVAFNQKVRRIGEEEDVWINEVRSEYAPTFLGYDDSFSGSNLEERYIRFLEHPLDNLVVWNVSPYDYGSVNMFGQYLAARFGEAFYREEIKTEKVGIASVTKVLSLLEPGLTFPEFFSEWRLTNYINNRGILDGKYSYQNDNIRFRLAPEFSMDLASLSQGSMEVIITPITWMSGKVISIFLGDNGARLRITPPVSSSDFVLTYVEESRDGVFKEGQFSLEGGSREIGFGKGAYVVTMIVSNASQEPTNGTFTIEAEVKTIFQPSITSIEPVFLNPTVENNAFLIKGADFAEGLTLSFNDQEQEFVYQNDRTLITKVSQNEKIITITITNPDSGLATFVWENPIAKDLPSIPTGSLIRALGDHRVYVIMGGFKRHLTDPTIFSFYGHLDASRIQDLDSPEVDAFQTSNLIRLVGGTKVYEVLSDGTKRWISSAQEFISRGLDWNAIFGVNERELNFYPDAP